MEISQEEAIKIATELSVKVMDGKPISDDIYRLMKHVKEETWSEAQKYYFRSFGH